MPLHLPIYNRQTDRQTDRKILANKRSQSALEYMMTYGWAILIIVIVAAVLYSFGIFSPSSSISATITGFSGLGSVAANCVYNEGLVISLGNSAGYLINVTSINITDTSISATTNAKIGSVISPSSNEIFLIPTACPAVGSRYSISAIVSYTEPGQTFPGPYVSTGTATGSVSNSNSPQQISYSEPLAIDPSSAQDPPSPFQQMINMTSSAPGWSHISSSLFGQNVEFTYPNGTVIPSWLENYTSSRAIWWVKLASYGSQTIFMDFVPISTNLFNTVNTGEAPQLSSTYGEYDNGANVFNNYWDFAGTTLPAGLSTTGDTTVNNGLTIDSSNGGAYGIYTNTMINSNNNILEAYMSQNDFGGLFYSISESGGIYSDTSWFISGTGTGESYNGVVSPNPNNQIITSVNGVPYGNGVSFSYPSGYAIYGVINVNNLAYNTLNYATIATAPTANSPSGQDYYAELFAASTTIYAYWLRTRAYPPNGVMPSVTFGSVS